MPDNKVFDDLDEEEREMIADLRRTNQPHALNIEYKIEDGTGRVVYGIFTIPAEKANRVIKVLTEAGEDAASSPVSRKPEKGSRGTHPLYRKSRGE